MLKQIPKSDINFRPFKVYKTFTFAESDITASLAYNHTGSTYILTDSELEENGLYHQLYTMYYRDPHNPLTSYGDITAISESLNNIHSQRYLSGSALVLPIKQKYFGEKIKPGSVSILSNITNENILDDSMGNLISEQNFFTLISLDINSGVLNIRDSNQNQYQLNVISINLENGVLTLNEQANPFTYFTANVMDDTISFNGALLGYDGIAKNTIGNVFYSHGIITITSDVEFSRKHFFDNYDLQYKSTNTIYENEYLLVVGEDEFNVSTNPTAYTEMNVETGSIELGNTTQYQIDATNISLPVNGGFILYLNDGGNEVTLTIDENIVYNFYANEILSNNLIGCSLQQFRKNNIVSWRNSEKYQKSIFSDYEYSSSIDTTGSYLAPYITTIGLYDENMDMVAVAKLAKPVKSTPDLPVNFLVRFDS